MWFFGSFLPWWHFQFASFSGALVGVYRKPKQTTHPSSKELTTALGCSSPKVHRQFAFISSTWWVLSLLHVFFPMDFKSNKWRGIEQNVFTPLYPALWFLSYLCSFACTNFFFLLLLKFSHHWFKSVWLWLPWNSSSPPPIFLVLGMNWISESVDL